MFTFTAGSNVRNICKYLRLSGFVGLEYNVFLSWSSNVKIHQKPTFLWEKNTCIKANNSSQDEVV